MLKITLHDTPEGLRFQLEGHLVGPWVNELEQCWRTAASIRGGRDVLLDLREVTFIDDAGKELLTRLQGEGVQFAARGPMTNAIVEDIRCARKLIDRLIHLTLVVLVVCLVAATPALAQDAALKLSLKDAVQIALKQNPQVAIANLNIAEAREGSMVQRSALLPQAELSAYDAVRRVNIQAQIGTPLPGF